MVASMTGFGAASADDGQIGVAVEARSVNGRFLKVSVKLPSGLNRYESVLEGVVKEFAHRGNVTLSVFVERTGGDSLVTVNEEVASAYQEVFTRLGLPDQNVAQLPGVIDTKVALELTDGQSALVEDTVRRAMVEMVKMRGFEGTKLRIIVEGICEEMGRVRGVIGTRAPDVPKEYQRRLLDRVSALLDGTEVTPDPAGLVREVALFADRADITEELDRLGAHLEQVAEKLAHGQEIGRALDFLAQELLRETNTIGSKSSDVAITQGVLALKGEVERFKEQVANIE